MNPQPKPTKPIAGGCVCGATRYELLSPPVGLNNCHCIDCRRSAGAPFVTWGSVRPADLRLVKGSIREIPHANRLRSFAACCGTHLFFREDTSSEWTDVTIASLDDPAPFPPEKNIWTEDRLPWVLLDPALPSFPRSSREGS